MIREALAGVIRLSWPEAELLLASDFRSAWREMARLPDLCLCDLSMPGAKPLEGVQELKSISALTPIVVVTASEDDSLLVDLFQIGIAGFIPKTSRSSLIEAAIRVVLAGGQYVPPRVIDLANSTARNHRPAQKEPGHPATRLTERQIEVLRLIATGQSNKEIARDLGLSPATVKAHVAAALGALAATNRTEAVMLARQKGLI